MIVYVPEEARSVVKAIERRMRDKRVRGMRVSFSAEALNVWKVGLRALGIIMEG